MLKTRLMTTATAVALFAAPAAFAQEVPTPEPTMPTPTQTPPTLPPTGDGTQAAPAPTPNPVGVTQDAAPAQTQETSVVAVLRADGRFTTLLSALDAAQLTTVLEAQPAVSIFAPTDEAFAALPEAERVRLMDPANVEELRSLLLYHVIAADVQSSQITGARGGVPTAGGAQVQLDGTGDAIKIDDATVVTADIDASNGAIFAIDKVLTPSASQAAMGDEQAVTPATPAQPAMETEPAASSESDEQRPVGVTTAPAPTPPADPADEATTPDQAMQEGQETSPAMAEPMSDDEGDTDAAPVPGEEEDEEEDPAEPEA